MLKILGIIKQKIASRLRSYFLTKFKKYDLPESIYIENPYTTLNKIEETIKSKIVGAYLRFGDGDINLLEGKDDLFQKNNKSLSIEMKEAFSLSGPGILKCLPLHSKKFGMMPFMRPGIHEASNEWAENILMRSYKFFVGSLIYSPIALSYVTTYNTEYAIDYYKFIKKNNLVFVGNKLTDKEVLYKLFGNIVHIPTPECNSFYEIDNIENSLSAYLEETKDEYTVVIVAMGCSGRILEKRILNKKFNCFMFDFGSTLDVFCNNKTRAWMKIDTNIKEDHFIKILNKI